MKHLKTILFAVIMIACTKSFAEEKGTIQKKTTNEQICKTNLMAAEAFLQKNASQDGVTTIVKDRLQVKVVKKGDGKICSATDTVVVQYKGSLMNGSVFDQSKSDVSFPLNKVVKGFKEGLVGMQVGEKRILYIHPSYGYGDNNKLPFPPNSLLIFEVELKNIN